MWLWWLRSGLVARECIMSTRILTSVEVQMCACDLWFAGGLFWLESWGSDRQLGMSLVGWRSHTSTRSSLMHHMQAYIYACSQTCAYCWNSFYCYSLPLNPSFLSLPHVLTMTSPCGDPPSFVSGMWFKFSLRLSLSPSRPIFLFYHTATYSQFSNHCLSASRWYVKPPRSTHENERPPCVEPAVVQLGAYSCSAYTVSTLTLCQ